MLKTQDLVRKELKFGAIVFLVAGLPTTFMLWLLINIPSGLFAAWTASSFLLYLIAGVISTKLIKI